MVILNQVDANDCDPNFKPPFLLGDPGVLDPYEDVVIPSYGITDADSDARIHDVYILWGKSSGVSGARRILER